MTKYPVFEILIDRRPGGVFELATQYFDVNDETIAALGPVPVRFDVGALRAAKSDGRETTYGNLLAKAVFHDRAVREQFADVLDKAVGDRVDLRFRLRIKEGAAELHEFDWERLGDPARLDWGNLDDLDRGGPLFTSSQVLFSRFLYSQDYRRAPHAPSQDPLALIAVANPCNLDEFGRGMTTPKPIRVGDIVAAAEGAMTGWRIKKLAGSASKPVGSGQATLSKLRGRLEDGVDVLFLACHGFASRDRSVLLLEDDDGRTAPVRSGEFVDMIGRLRTRPRLIVLASCQSAGTNEPEGRPLEADPGAEVRWRLGPDLCRKGVAAVVAMQGNLTQETAVTFLDNFFSGIRNHGQLDYAMTQARRQVRRRGDWSVPTLFMRLRNGRFRSSTRRLGEFTKWPQIKLAIEEQRCLPIFGPSASERLLGTKEDIAQRLSDRLNFPLAPHQMDQLQQVANYVQVNNTRRVLRNELRKVLTVSLADRFDSVLQSSTITLTEDTEDGQVIHPERLNEALVAITKHLAVKRIGEPHEVLARLPFPLYVTTEPTDILYESIKHGGRQPVKSFYPWRLLDPTGRGDQPIAWPADADDPLSTERGFESSPDPDHPVVYHLFGHLEIQGSVALTPDDFFEFLIGIRSPSGQFRNPATTQALNSNVKEALSSSLLLFVGFSTDDWEFRVLLWMLRTLYGTGGEPNIAVQLDPDEDRTLAPDRAREYLIELLRDQDMSIYWGSTEMFATDLDKQTGGLKVKKEP